MAAAGIRDHIEHLPSSHNRIWRGVCSPSLRKILGADRRGGKGGPEKCGQAANRSKAALSVAASEYVPREPRELGPLGGGEGTLRRGRADLFAHRYTQDRISNREAFDGAITWPAIPSESEPHNLFLTARACRLASFAGHRYGTPNEATQCRRNAG